MPFEHDPSPGHDDLVVAQRRMSVRGSLSRGAGRCADKLAGKIDVFEHLGIGGLREISVGLPDRVERLRCLQRDQLVGIARES